MMRILISLNLFGLLALGLFSLNGNSESPPEKTQPQAETRIKIAVIDTGLWLNAQNKPFLCRGLSKSFVDETPFSREADHGTNIVGLITQDLDPKKFCIVILKFWKPEISDIDNEVAAIKYATKIGAKFLNMSLHGLQYSSEEYDALSAAINSGMKISVSSGNSSELGPERDASGSVVYKKDENGKKIVKCHREGLYKVCEYEIVLSEMGKDLSKSCDIYPACYHFPKTSFHVVGSSTGKLNAWGGIHRYGNYGSPVTHWEDGTSKGYPVMSGTSQATAIHTGKWALGKIK